MGKTGYYRESPGKYLFFLLLLLLTSPAFGASDYGSLTVTETVFRSTLTVGIRESWGAGFPPAIIRGFWAMPHSSSSRSTMNRHNRCCHQHRKLKLPAVSTAGSNALTSWCGSDMISGRLRNITVHRLKNRFLHMETGTCTRVTSAFLMGRIHITRIGAQEQGNMGDAE